MVEKFKPDMYQKDIYAIDYKKLKSLGIKCLLFDLDNTIISKNNRKLSRKLKDLIENLKDKGFRVIIFSNAPKAKIRPFKDYLEVDCSANSRKPCIKKFKKILKIFKYEESEVAIIGDQLLTDILGGNKVGIYTILVDPIEVSELIFTKINRFFEKIVIKRLKKHHLFEKGKYYD